MPVLQHLLQLIVDELDLGSDDDLASGLAGADDTGSTGSLDGLLVDSSAVLDLKAQTSSAVVNVGNVALAADSTRTPEAMAVKSLLARVMLASAASASSSSRPGVSGELDDSELNTR